MCYLIVKVSALIWQVGTKKKWQQNNPIPTGMIKPKAETCIPGWVNTLHRESVSSDSSVFKGVSHIVLLRRC